LSSKRTALILCFSFAISLSGVFFLRSTLTQNITVDYDYNPKQTIRVLLSKSTKQHKIFLESSCEIIAKYRRSYKKDNSFYISISNNSLLLNGKSVGEKIEIVPDNYGVFSLDGKRYRGRISFEIINDTIYIINTLATEAYLAGVVAAEMPAYWEMEALKAQSITARTYSLFIRDTFGKKRNWDVRTSQANQVYRGIAAEHVRSWNAVNKTQGLVLTDPESAQENGIFPAYYCSVCGGHSENSKFVFGDSFQALSGVECPFCRETASNKFLNWGKFTISKKEAFAKLKKKYPTLEKLKSLSKILPIRESKYETFSRITRFRIVGTNGKTDIVGGEDLRLTLDPSGQKIKSCATSVIYSKNSITFTGGKGFGHAVGLCQYGALAMARKKYKYNEILAYYYPGSKIKRIY